MGKFKIQAIDNAPLLITGDLDDVEILDGEGNVMEKPQGVWPEGRCYLCRCGLTTNPPFCSGAHKGVFKNEVRAKK
ncbi:Iron-binding zinc finger CDGSH type [compost metagenome]